MHQVHRSRFLSLCLLSASLMNCGRSQKNESELAFAHFPAKSSFGGPLGRALALRLGFDNDFPKLRICVQQTVQTELSSHQVIFETRLAYAAWLSGADLATNDVWQAFEFFTGDCLAENTASAFVTLGLHGGREAQVFTVPKIDCRTTAGGMGCNATSITLGLGGPGAVATWFRQSSPNKWTKLAHARPSSTWLSPYTNWTSLQSFIQQALNQSPGNSDLAALNLAVAEAVAQENPSLEVLLGINQQITSLQLKDAKDKVFNQITQEFFRGRRTSLQQEYKPTYSAYHVMLHEIGHEFGMDHADNPSESSVTGGNIAISQNANGQFTTDQSSMAYAEPYFYLTEDDRLGVRALRDELEELLSSHKE